MITRNLKSKSFGVSAIMKNPKLSKQIEDAFNSPIGSTKREQAKTLLRTVMTAGNKRISNNLDGQGGQGGQGGVIVPSPNMSYNPYSPSGSSSPFNLLLNPQASATTPQPATPVRTSPQSSALPTTSNLPSASMSINVDPSGAFRITAPTSSMPPSQILNFTKQFSETPIQRTPVQTTPISKAGPTTLATKGIAPYTPAAPVTPTAPKVSTRYPSYPGIEKILKPKEKIIPYTPSEPTMTNKEFEVILRQFVPDEKSLQQLINKYAKGPTVNLKDLGNALDDYTYDPAASQRFVNKWIKEKMVLPVARKIEPVLKKGAEFLTFQPIKDIFKDIFITEDIPALRKDWQKWGWEEQMRIERAKSKVMDRVAEMLMTPEQLMQKLENRTIQKDGEPALKTENTMGSLLTAEQKRGYVESFINAGYSPTEAVEKAAEIFAKPILYRKPVIQPLTKKTQKTFGDSLEEGEKQALINSFIKAGRSPEQAKIEADEFFNKPISGGTAVAAEVPKPEVVTPAITKTLGDTLTADQKQTYVDSFVSAGYTPEQAKIETDKILNKPSPSTIQPSTTPAITPTGAVPTAPTGGDILDLTDSAMNQEGFTGTREEYLLKKWSSLPPEQQTQLAPLYSAAISNIGSATFANQLMTDRKMMNTFTGMPEDAFPEGATISKQTESLKETLRKSFNLDEIEADLKAKKAQGVNIEKNLVDYIKGKDEYLAKVDTMIADAKDFIYSSDVSDPTIANRMDNYLKYLAVLKGRQETRYGDYVKNSIDEYNNNYKTASELYTETKKIFEEEFQSQKEMVKENYNIFTKMIDDMYKNVIDMEKNDIDSQKSQYDLLSSYYSTLKSATEAGKASSGDIIKDKPYYDSILSSGGETIQTGTTKTDIINLFTGSLQSAIDMSVSQGKTESGLIKAVAEEIKNNAKSLIQSGDTDKFLTNYPKVINNYYNNNSNNPQTVRNAAGLAEVFLENTDKYLKESLSQDSATVDNIKLMIQNLFAPTGLLFKKSKSIDDILKNRNKIVTEYSNAESNDVGVAIDPAITNAVINLAEGPTIKNFTNPLDIFTTSVVPKLDENGNQVKNVKGELQFERVTKKFSDLNYNDIANKIVLGLGYDFANIQTQSDLLQTLGQ